MTAIDYVFREKGGKVYLTKPLKNNAISKDSREISEKEIIGMFAFYFSKYCKENSTDNIEVSFPSGQKFTCKWLSLSTDNEESSNEQSE